MEITKMEIPQTTVKIAGNGGFGIPASTPVPTVSLASTAATPRRSVDPHSLAHKQLSKAARAVLGAEILDGNLPLMNPTIEMVARAVGVSAGYIGRAKQLSPEARREVARGNRPLVCPKASPSPVLSVEQRFTNIVVELGGVAPALDALAAVERRNGNGNGA
jgi:hypothetical protein